MTTARSAQDVFQMAIDMEQVGRDFYVALAMGSDNTSVRTFCARLAKEEEAHLATFKNLRSKWEKAVAASRPGAQAAEALAELVKSQVQPDPREVQKVAIGGKLADAVAMAIQMEQDSINFYQGMIANLPDSAQAIQAIIEQERKHLVGLKSVM